MEIGWTDVGSGEYILVNCAHSNTSFDLIYSEIPSCIFHFHLVMTFAGL